MFVVYKLFFESSDKIYIGKTYDINKRLADHNYTVFVLNEQTYKGNWSRKHSEICDIQYEILFETEDEQEAYIKELEIIKDCINRGIPIVNTQRLVEAGGRKGLRVVSDKTKKIMRNRFGVAHVLVDKEGNEIHTDCLKAFGESVGVDYKNLHSSATGYSYMSNGYKVFYKDHWDSLTEEERATLKKEISTYDPHNTEATKAWRDKQKKEFWLLNKDGSVEHGWGAEKYFKSKGYNSGNLFNSHRTRRPQYGKMLFYTEEDMEYFKQHEMHKFLYKLSEEEKWAIFDEVATTPDKSRERGEKVRELSEKYFCSYRKIADIYREFKTKKRYG